MELVKQVELSRIPAKRKMMIRPRGRAAVYLCTVCATVADNRKGVLMGFQIHDSWETTAGAWHAAPAGFGVSPMRGVRAEPEPKLGQPPS